MAHHNGNGDKSGKTWNDRELERAPLTTTALEEAVQSIIKTIKEYPEVPGADHKKGDLLNRLTYSIGTAVPTDAEGHPTLRPVPERYKHHLPKTIGELKQRIDRIANNLSDDTYMQDMCRAASEAATHAAKQATVAQNKR